MYKRVCNSRGGCKIHKIRDEWNTEYLKLLVPLARNMFTQR